MIIRSWSNSCVDPWYWYCQ